MAYRLTIGEEVLINVCPENREHGYNPGPDDTRVTVVGFHMIDGERENPSAPYVRFPDGHEACVGRAHLRRPDEPRYCSHGHRATSSWTCAKCGEDEREQRIRALEEVAEAARGLGRRVEYVQSGYNGGHPVCNGEGFRHGEPVYVVSKPELDTLLAALKRLDSHRGPRG